MRTCVRERNGVLKSLFPDRDVSEIEGEFAPDTHEPNQPDQEYRGEFRFVNLGPQKLRQIAAHAPQVDQAAVQTALRAWAKMSPNMGIEAGEPYRGEPRQAIVAGSMRELVANLKPVKYVTVGSLSPTGTGIMSPSGSSEPHWLGIFDFDVLQEGLKER
jgi:hypothetical protein